MFDINLQKIFLSYGCVSHLIDAKLPCDLFVFVFVSFKFQFNFRDYLVSRSDYACISYRIKRKVDTSFLFLIQQKAFLLNFVHNLTILGERMDQFSSCLF